MVGTTADLPVSTTCTAPVAPADALLADVAGLKLTGKPQKKEKPPKKDKPSQAPKAKPDNSGGVAKLVVSVGKAIHGRAVTSHGQTCYINADMHCVMIL